MKAKLSLYLSGICCSRFSRLGVGCTKAPNDAQLTSNIQSKLATDSGLQGKQLGVKAESGTVTLSGTVDNDAEREAAARYASTEPGVKQVINNLPVAAPPPVDTAKLRATARHQPSACSRFEIQASPAPKPRRHVRERSTPRLRSITLPGSSGRDGATRAWRRFPDSAAPAATEESHDSFRHNSGGTAGGYH